MDKGEPRVKLKPRSEPISMRAGFKRTMAAIVDGKEIDRDEVKLWHAKSREDFAKRCIRALNGNLSSKDAEKIQKQIDEWLRQHETGIKAQIQSKKKTQSINDSEINEEQKKEALTILRDPALLFKAGQFLHKLGLAGETKIALILYLVLTSRLLQKIISAASKAESSTGKSFIVDTVLKLFPPEAYVSMSGMSKQALIYLNESYAHRMLIVAEAVGIEGASFNIRTLLSEGKLVFQTVEKNPETGKNETRTINKEGPTGLITTTTWSQLHPENETRLISLALDESEAQTQAVKEAIASQYEEIKEGPNLAPWVNAQRILKPVQVRIPYATFLAERTPNKPLRMRRDFGKLISFIEASAVYHQYQRKQIKEGLIEAGLVDYFIAKILLEDVFFQSLYNLHPNTQKLMEAIKQLRSENPNQLITTRKLMDHLDWSKSRVTRWVKPLKDYDWVEKGSWGEPDFYYRPGIDPRQSTSKLPSVEELAEKFPELARGFQAVHPLTGEVLNLCNDVPARDSNQVMGEGVSDCCKSE